METMSVSLVVTVSGIDAGAAAFTYWPGALKAIDGAWLSVSTVTIEETAELPAASVAVARSSYERSARAVVFHGDEMTLQVEPPSLDAWRTTPGDVSWLSVAFAVTVTGPETFAPSAGAVSETLGLVRSTNQVYDAAAPRLPARSVARTWKVWLPSARAPSVSGVEHAVHEPPSTLQSNVAVSPALKPKVGVVTPLGSPGFTSIELVGEVVSTSTIPPVATASLPTLSEMR